MCIIIKLHFRGKLSNELFTNTLAQWFIFKVHIGGGSLMMSKFDE